MAKRPGIWAYGFAIGLMGAGVAGSSGCDNTEFINEGIPFSEMPADMAKALCVWVEGCWTGGGLGLRDQCLARSTPNFVEGRGPALAAGIADGRIEYYAQSASDCLEALSACGKDQQFPAICIESTFKGQVALGGGCLHSFDCAGDATCVAGATCPGTCVAWAAAGAACGNELDCDRNLRCLGGVCTVTVGENEPCTNDNNCNYDLLCLRVDGAGKCVDVGDYLTGTEGEACGTFAAGIPDAPLCEIELVCAQDSAGSNTGTCAARVGAGDVCSLAFLSQCPQAYSCTATPGECDALPTSGACADLYGEPICDAGYACLGGECAAQEENGSDCTSNAQCESGSCLGGKCGPQFVCDPDG